MRLDGDVLGDVVTGHQFLKVGKQIGIPAAVVAHGIGGLVKRELFGLVVIGDGRHIALGQGKHRQGAAQQGDGQANGHQCAKLDSFHDRSPP